MIKKSFQPLQDFPQRVEHVLASYYTAVTMSIDHKKCVNILHEFSNVTWDSTAYFLALLTFILQSSVIWGSFWVDV